MLAAIVAALAALPTAAPPVVWQGVTLGEPTASAIDRLGQPDSRRKAIKGTFVLEYRAFGGLATLTLTDSSGTISGISLFATDPSSLRPPPQDPFGVALGDSGDRLSEVRGQPQRYDDDGGGEFTSYYGRISEVRWTYGLRDNTIYSIGVIAPYRIVRATGAVVPVPTPRPANAPTPPPPDAGSFDRAVIVTPDDIAANPRFEFAYVENVACGNGDHFVPTAQTIVNLRHRNFNKIDAKCPSTGETRSFYFDVTAVFGRYEP